MPLKPLNILDSEKAYTSIFKQYYKWPAVNKQKDLLLFFSNEEEAPIIQSSVSSDLIFLASALQKSALLFVICSNCSCLYVLSDHTENLYSHTTDKYQMKLKEQKRGVHRSALV